jgi:nitroreductase
MESKQARTDAPVHALIAARWSPYAWSPRPVAETDLRSLFEAARWAPSSYNEQPWSYLVARREQGEEFASLLSCLVEGNQTWARAVPVLALGIVSRVLRRSGKPNPAAAHDLGLASANLCLEATARGLCVHQMIGILPDRARELYAIPETAEALTGLAIGYPAGAGDDVPAPLRERDRGARQRRPAREFVFEAAWQRPAGFVTGS